MTLPGPDEGWREYQALQLEPILDAALSCFVERGYHGTSMREVAQLSGASMSSIYSRYPGKQHLLTSLYEAMFVELSDRLQQSLQGQQGFTDRLESIVECLVRFHMARQPLAFVALTELRSLEPANQESVIASRRTIQRQVDEIIHQGVEEGIFATTEPGVVSRAIVRMCITLAQEPARQRDTAQHIEVYTALARRMVAAHPE